jgi:delta1-piperideine-2-carboxylate reductase
VNASESRFIEMEQNVKRLTPDELVQLVSAIFVTNGMSPSNAAAVAKVVMEAERDGSFSHGLFRIPAYVTTLQSGNVDGAAIPIVIDAAPSVAKVDASNGFAQPAIEAGRHLLLQKARKTGLASMAIYNSHHFAALWPDVETFAEEGMIALAFVNSRMRIAPWDAPRKLIGTNPMAFACPRADGPPLVWDQASSVMAQGAVLIAAREGRELDEGVLLDAAGRPTTDANALQAGGALRSFGTHKGSSIALMVEILAAALTGGNFGFEDTESELRGSATQNAGELILVIDPVTFGSSNLAQRVSTLLSHLQSGGVTRFPSESRHKARAENSAGIPVSATSHAQLIALAGKGA